MKKVKYVWMNFGGIGLTTGKVYDVIKYDNKNNTIEFFNDLNELRELMVCYTNINKVNMVYFEDVTSEYRNELIDEIIS